MKLIPLYALNGATNDGNVVLAVRDDSSNRKRLDATYHRKFSSFNPGTKVYSVPTCGVAIRRDVVGVDGDPSGQRASASVDFRLPVMASETDLDDLIADLRAYVNDVDLKTNVIKQLVPTCCATDEA